MTTPLQELIDILRSMRIAATAQAIRFNTMGMTTSETSSEAMETAYKLAEEKAKELLPKEKEVIVNAFFNGGKDVSTRDYEDAETYYHQTFNTQETDL